jgi:hypothetical protein
MIDKGKVKKFAINARRTLIGDIKLRLRQIGIDENGIADKLPESTVEIEYYSKIPGTELTGSKIFWRQDLVEILNRRKKKTNLETALKDTIEEVAYTWFNRIIAIRFMEVNDYLPSRTRVLSSEEGHNQPDIMFHALELEDDLGKYTLEERNLIKRAQKTNKPADMDAMYSMLFIKQADALRQNLPYLFEKTSDYMKLLFTPRYSNGVIKDLVTQIPESYFDVEQEGQVEIIGWLYQYYNTELKENIISQPKSIKYNDKQIAEATQIFTPDWIVKYMVQNSLGKYWIKCLKAGGNNKSEAEIASDFNWNYYMPDAKQEDSVLKQEKNLRDEFASKKIEQITFLDPSMGSGHILIYAFDVFMQIYTSLDYSQREAAERILKTNIFGLDIDKRAFQIAYFAVMMKYREFDRKALKKQIKLNLFDIPESDNLKESDFEALSVICNSKELINLRSLAKLFKNGKTFGSLILPNDLNLENLINVLAKYENDFQTSFELQFIKEKLIKFISVAKIINRDFTIISTNPPYMGSSRMNAVLAKYSRKNFNNSKSDLFSMFMERWNNSLEKNGFCAMVTMQSWMFLSSFNKMRGTLLSKFTISNLMHMENNVMGIAFGTAVTILWNNYLPDFKGTYHQIKTNDVSKKIPEKLPIRGNRYNCPKQTNFSKIPGSPIAYWASKNLIHDFEIGISMDKIVDARQGLATADNNRFLRQWFEVAINNICFNAKSLQESLESRKKWFPYNKGGAYRKWYGNYDYVVNWENGGYEIRNFKDANGKLRSRPQNTDYYFREAITWPKITSGKFNVRLRLCGSIHDTAGNEAFNENREILLYCLALVNSKVNDQIIYTLNPTLNAQVGDFSRIPVLKSGKGVLINKIVLNLICIAKQDWDSFETSWDFKHHPLLNHIAEHKQNLSLKAAYDQWEKEALDRFNQLKSNEEKLNRIFIDLYGLQDELTPEEDDKDVTVRKADKERDIKSFLSYFVGCVFGRYSLDVEVLTYAGGQWNDDNYQSFKPNKDNLILLTDKDYFGDQRDLINRLQQFLIVIFGKENLSDNLTFIAEALDSKKLHRGIEARDIIREYFIKDFYKDHCKIYQKRPIYWEINSGRNNGFKALFYLHRYDQNTMSIAREKLHELQNYYESNQKADKQQLLIEKDKKVIKQLKKEVEKLNKELDEIIKFDTPLQHVAGEKIKIDLDDGVLVNHQKVQGKEKLLSKI